MAGKIMKWASEWARYFLGLDVDEIRNNDRHRETSERVDSFEALAADLSEIVNEANRKAENAQAGFDLLRAHLITQPSARSERPESERLDTSAEGGIRAIEDYIKSNPNRIGEEWEEEDDRDSPVRPAQPSPSARARLPQACLPQPSIPQKPRLSDRAKDAFYQAIECGVNTSAMMFALPQPAMAYAGAGNADSEESVSGTYLMGLVDKIRNRNKEPAQSPAGRILSAHEKVYAEPATDVQPGIKERAKDSAKILGSGMLGNLLDVLKGAAAPFAVSTAIRTYNENQELTPWISTAAKAAGALASAAAIAYCVYDQSVDFAHAKYLLENAPLSKLELAIPAASVLTNIASTLFEESRKKRNIGRNTNYRD